MNDFKQSPEGNVGRAGRFDHMVGAKIDEQIIAFHRSASEPSVCRNRRVRRDVNT